MHLGTAHPSNLVNQLQLLGSVVQVSTLPWASGGGGLASPACSAQVNAFCCTSARIDLLRALALFSWTMTCLEAFAPGQKGAALKHAESRADTLARRWRFEINHQINQVNFLLRCKEHAQSNQTANHIWAFLAPDITHISD